MTTIAEFYADAHLGTPFGIQDALHNWHSGQDVSGWKIRTPIPSLCRGRVVTRGSNPGNLGHFVTIRAEGRPERFSYCHLDSLDGVPEVGAVVERGGYVGPLGNSGFSTGPHTHVMVSLTSNDPRTYQGLIDPLPYMVAARIAPAGGDAEPFPTPKPIDESEEDDMRLLYVTDSVDGNNIPGWVLLNPRTGKTVILRADDPKNQERANSWAAVWGTARRCTRQELANAQAAILSTSAE